MPAKQRRRRSRRTIGRGIRVLWRKKKTTYVYQRQSIHQHALLSAVAGRIIIQRNPMHESARDEVQVMVYG